MAMLFAWGRNSDSQCGDDLTGVKSPLTIPLPAFPWVRQADKCVTRHKGLLAKERKMP